MVPACLPTDSQQSYSGQTAYVSGWGTTQEGGPVSDVLRETEQTVLASSDPACLTGSQNNPVPGSKLCAYREGTDSCQGDSGGPLVVREGGRSVLTIISGLCGC